MSKTTNKFLPEVRERPMGRQLQREGLDTARCAVALRTKAIGRKA